MTHHQKVKRVVLLLIFIIFFFITKGQSTIENAINEDFWYVSKCGSSSYRKIASPFTTPSGRIKVTKIEVNSYDNNSNFLAYARIETSSSGSPTNTVVTNGTSNSVACSPAGWVAMTYTAGSQPILSASTTYFVVLSGTSGSTSTSCQFRTNNDLGNISKWTTTSNCSSETWVACSSYGDLLYKIYYENADPTAPSLISTGSSSQITFNNSNIYDNTPLFRASATHSSSFDRFQIEVNTASDYTGTSYKQTFSSTYSSGTAYDLECTSLDNSWSPSNGTTYYVRVRASADGGSNYGAWSTGTYSFTYKTSGDVEWMQTTTAALGTSTLTHTQGTSDYINMSITSGFTYGTTTDLGTNDNGSGYLVIQKIYATYDFTLQSLNVYFRALGTGSKKYVLALYDDDGTGGIPGTRLAYTSEQTASATGLNNITPTSTPSLSAGYYYIAYTSNDANLKISYASTPAGLGGGYVARTYDGTLPSSSPVISTYGTSYNYSFSLSTTLPQGTALSPAINYSSFTGCSAWQEVSWSETETTGNVKMQVWYDNSGTPTIVPDGTISGNSSGIASSPINISSLNTTTYSKLYLKALLTYSGGSPRLNDWKVTANYGSSNESDIAEAGFDEPDNISYKDYQTASSLTTSNSIKIGSFTIRDGGADLTDADTNPTSLTDILFTVSNSSNIRALAIFDGTTNLKEVTSVSATTTFSSISGLSASDNSSKTFDVYATFKTTVTDNQQIQLSVSSTTTSGSASSLFATSNAGGASTSTAGDDNRLEVTATKLEFTTQPSVSACINANLGTAAVVQAKDVNDNLDLDYSGTVTLTNSQGYSTSNNAIAASSGVSTFTNLQFSTGGGSTTLSTTNGDALTNATSNAITVNVLPTIAATVSTGTFTMTSMKSGGEVLNNGGSSISAQGVCWNTSGSPTLSDYYTTDISDTDYVSVITGLTKCTMYYVRSYATNACGTTYSTTTRTGITSCDESDIIEASFDEPDNIDYANYQSASGLTASNAIKIASFTIRDGGADLTDYDTRYTGITSITFTVSNSSNIRAMAIYDGTTLIKEVTSVSASTTFSSFSSNLRATDNSTKTFDVYATFKSAVTDNQQIQLTISSVTAGANGTSFYSAANAGGASSSVAGDDNRIEVTATKLSITTEPSSSVCPSTNLATPPAFTASDANNNTDIDFTGTVGLTNAGSIAMTGNSVAASSGVVTFTNLQFTTGGVAGALTTTNVASLTNITTATSISVTAALSAPIISSHNQTTTSLTWNWGAVSGASSYQTSYDGGAWTSNGTSTSYNKTSLGVNTQHRLNIKTINSCGNSSAETGDTYYYTSANAPTAPTIAVVNSSSLSVNVNVNSNPASTEFAIYCNTTSNYVQADGSLGASAVWQTDATWGTTNVTGLSPNTTYTFKVKARNGDSDETAFSGNGSGTTPCAPATIPFFEGFENGFSNSSVIGGCYTQQDVDDGDAGDWYSYDDGSPYAHSGTWEAALYHGHTDDWLFIPVALTSGLNYSFSMYAYQESSTASYGKITVKYGTANTSAGMTSGTIVNETNIGTSYQQLSGTISPSSTGTYYIGIKGYVHADVYYYLYIDDISIEVILDQDSKVEEPASQITATSISSVNNDAAGEAMEVFKFKITDLSTTDTEPTKVTNIRIKPGSANTADWSNSIQGVKLHNGTDYVTIGAPSITDSYIDIPITSGNLNISDGSSLNMTLYTYLNTSNIVDGAILDFRIDYDDHGFTSDNTGSSFASSFGSADVEGNNITIAVVASKLSFSASAPASALAINSNFMVTVNATDANGNIDNSGSGDVTLSRASGSGTLSSTTGLTQSINSGTVSWNDLSYDALANCSSTFLTILADHATLTDATTSCIQVVGAPGAFDFITSNSSGCAGNFSITWSASSGATSYDLYYCEGINCNPIYSTNIITGVTSGYSFNAINANSEYNFAVLAKNVATETWSSSYINRTTWTGNTWIGATNTNWSTATNWCGGVVPTSANDIVISAGLTHYPVLTADASVNNITVEAGASLGLGSFTLNVFGNVDFSAGTLNAGTGKINMTAGNSSFLISNGTTTVYNGDKFYDTGGLSGNYNSNQNITNVLAPAVYGDKVTLKFIANYFDGDRLIIYDSDDATGTVLFDGEALEASLIGSFTATNSSGALTVQFISGGFFQYSGWEAEISVENPLTRTIDIGTNDLYHFEISGRKVYISNNTLDVNGNLAINSGSLYANGQNIELAGNWTNHAVFSPGIGTVTFDGSSDATIEKNGPTIIVYSTSFEDADGGTAGWFTGSIPNHTEWRRQSGAIAGNRIAPNNGTYDVGAYNLHDNTPGYYYTTDASKNCYATLSKLIDLRDVVDAQLSFFWYYQGGGPAGADSYNGMVNVDGIRFDDFLRWSTSWTQEVYDISEFCNKEATVAFDMNLIYYNEAPDDPGKYGYAIDDVVITGTSCAESFNHIVINKSGGASVSLSSTHPTRINVEGDVLIETGTFKAQDNRIRCKGDFTANGAFTPGNGDVTMNGSSIQRINGSQNITFYNLFKESSADLIIGDALASGKTIEVTNDFSWTDNNDKIIVGDGTPITFKIAGNMNIAAGCTLETKNNTVVSIAGNYTDYGTFIPNQGLVKFHGSANSYIIREPAEVLFLEDFEDGNSTGWTFVGGSEDVEWAIHSGSSHNSTYDLATRGAGSYPVPYSYWADGSTSTTTDAYLTIDLTGYTNVELQFYWKLGGKLNDQYGQLLIDSDGYGVGNAPILLMDNMYKEADYILSPRFDISQYANGVVTLIYRFISTGDLGGGNPGFCVDDIVLTGTSVNLETFYDISVDKGSSKSAVLRCPIDVDNNVTITNGDLNSGGISFPVGQNWTNLNASTFTHQNNTITFDGNGEGKNQTITNNSLNKFFNVEINNSTGTVKLASNRWYLDSNLTITAGTIRAGTTAGVDDQDIYIHGHWKNIGGTFTPLNKTVFFRGVADQQLITNNSPFYNVTLPTEKENALILNDKLTINNNLLLTSGILDVTTNIQDIDINGHWLNNGGTFLHPNNTTTKVTFGGNSAQLINKKADALTSPPGTTFEFNFSFDNVIINGSDVRFYIDSEGGKLLNVRNLTINATKKFSLIDD